MSVKLYPVQTVNRPPEPIIRWHLPHAVSKQARVWITNRENFLLTALIVVHLIPIWAFIYFPSQDGPAHLENANIIHEYHQPDQTAFRTYYILNQNLTPNWAGHLVLASLMSFLPILVAEKVFLSGYIILFPISVRYAVSAVRPESTFLAVLAFPFIYNYLFHMGFYSFAFSLPIFFFFSGYWIKYREQFSLRQIVVQAVLSVLLFWGHITSMVAAFVAMALMSMWLIFLKFRDRGIKQGLFLYMTRNALQPLSSLYSFVPAIILFTIFFFQSKRYELPMSWADKPPLMLLLNQFVSLYALVSYDRWEIWISRGVVFLFVTISVYILRSKSEAWRLTFWDGFVVVAAIYALVYFVGPSESGGAGYIHDRMSLFPFLVLILWFAAYSYGEITKRLISISTIGLTTILLGVHAVKYAELNNYLDEYLAGLQLIQPNTTLLPIYFSEGGDEQNAHSLSLRINFMLNAAGYIAAERHIVDLSNYEAGQTRYFPTLFRPDLNPAAQLQYLPLDRAAGEMWALPTEILSYPKRTGGQIDYVLVWGVREQDHNKEIPKFVFAQLQEDYELIYNSSQRGLMQLYRHKDLSFTP